MQSKKQMNLSKCCKNCGSEFVIPIPEKNGSGSTGSLRRIYCNDKCKNEFGRKKKEGKVDRCCKVCENIFVSYPSQQRSYCSKKCQNESKKVSVFKRTCEYCGDTFEGKPSELNSYYCSRKCFHKAGRITKTCITCSKPFEIKKSDNHLQRCSRECQYIDQSNGKIKIHLNGRTGYRKDINLQDYFKSALEADFARFVLYMGYSYLYEKKTFITDKGAYTPDFYIPELNTYVELKGVEKNNSAFSKIMTKNLDKASTLQNENIFVITQKMFINALKNANLWLTIPNLEQRNYRNKKTLELIITYEDQKNQQKNS